MDNRKSRKPSPKPETSEVEPQAPVFEVLTGLNYNDTRREAGEIVSDIPSGSIAWLIEQGAIRPVESEK